MNALVIEGLRAAIRTSQSNSFGSAVGVSAFRACAHRLDAIRSAESVRGT